MKAHRKDRRDVRPSRNIVNRVAVGLADRRTREMIRMGGDGLYAPPYCDILAAGLTRGQVAGNTPTHAARLWLRCVAGAVPR